MHPDLSDAVWHKSSLSGNGASCVEVAIGKSVIAVRDTKDREAGMLMFTPDEWRAFIGGVRLGEFDL
ncbi:DUF397 domain-containing protein [Nonomuraea longicatena]|uniref:DUF397 domain-containing protein n=1 Tax=Nonomuraea longicatena TaxID=83682 RepID=A0ABN1P1W6_9ACTN